MLVGARAGSSYSEPEYVNWLRDAGFSDVRRVRLPGPAGMMIAAGAQFSELDLSRSEDRDEESTSVERLPVA
jgi:hypothetical protein